MKSLTLTQVITLSALSLVLFSCSRYRCKIEGDDKIVVEYDEHGFKVGDKIDCGFHTCEIIEVLGQPTPPPPVNDTLTVPLSYEGFPGNITTIAWPEEIDAAVKGDKFTGYIGENGILYIEFNNVRNNKH